MRPRYLTLPTTPTIVRQAPSGFGSVVAEQRPHRLPRRSDLVVEKPRDGDVVPGARAVLQDLGVGARPFVRRQRRRYAGIEARHQEEQADVAQRIGVGRGRNRGEGRHDRRPQLRKARIVEARRHHADDLIDLIVQPDLAADDRGVAAELLEPRAVTEDDDRRRACDVILGPEHPSEVGCRAHHLEERA
ncbi:MAG: hypothetical protein Q7R30_05510 [Acidobacteriota bacterium]|nr:hypothetical protein [Acidobacteriota bacterium]